MFRQRSEGSSQVGILLQLPYPGGSSIWLQQGFDAAAPLVLQLLSSLAPIVCRDRTHWEPTLTKLNCWLQHLRSDANNNECCSVVFIQVRLPEQKVVTEVQRCTHPN